MSRYIICFLFVFGCLSAAMAESYCYNCNVDSLMQVKQKAKTPEEKIQLLAILVELRPDTLMLDELIQLSLKVKSFEVEPYKKMREAYAFLDRNDWNNALISMKEAVELFDKQKKVISNLLLNVRSVFNNLNKQEERLAYYQKKLEYYQLNGPVENTASCYHGLAGYYSIKNDFNTAIGYYLKAAQGYYSFYYEMYLNEIGVVGDRYAKWGNETKAQEYLNIALKGFLQIKDSANTCFVYSSLAELAAKTKEFKKAQQFAFRQLENASDPINTALANTNIAEIYLLKAEPEQALPYLLKAKHLKDSLDLPFLSTYGELEINYYFYLYSQQMHQTHKAEKYLLLASAEAMNAQLNEQKLKYFRELSLLYGENGNAIEAHKYNLAYHTLKDSLESQVGPFNIAQYENEQKETAQNTRINTLKQERTVQEATIKQRNLILWVSISAILLTCAFLIFLYKQLSVNKKTLSSLRETQAQLIQSEKMASLGELTAGIAHEIQNPLNFVNNFSEVNRELVDELQSELKDGNVQEALAISNDIKDNEEKINHHGKRADSIVKGMLQHSRQTKSIKEPTDINTLCDEYLRLAYHGLRAKDKSFNTDFKTDFDETIGKINIVPQDVGRVLLNLFNNAFYAVNEKKQKLNGTFEPIVNVSTKKENGNIVLKVEDNGNGIPQNIVDKIFQPFFTTKPTGQGTGLGLSLSYDIIRAHGGELNVKTQEGEGSVFIIQLPV